MSRRSVACVVGIIATLSMLVPSVVGAPSSSAVSGLSATEKSMLGAIDYESAWEELEYLSSLGEKVAGSDEERAAQEYVMSVFESMPLDKVVMETFPCQTWDHKGTSLEILLPVYQKLPATTYGGSHSIWGYENGELYTRGNNEDGTVLTAPVVDAGYGTAEEFKALGDITGTIALVHRDDDIQGWPNVPLEEAESWGAVAVVFYGYYGDLPLPDGIKQDAVGGTIPAISISINSANAIKAQLATGDEVVLRIQGRADLIPDEKAKSVNVAAYLYGSTRPDEYVVFSAHIDTWWWGTNDDCSGIACVLEFARLFSEARESGLYTNERTLVFCSFGAEEYGGPDGTWYNWLIGSYEFVKSHGKLVDRTVVDLNLDMVSLKKTSGRYWVEASPDMNDFLYDAITDLKLTGPVTYYNPQYSWVDAWSFHAKGGTSSVNVNWVANQDETYHTQLDNMELADPAPLKIVLDLYTVMGIRADNALVLPANIMNMVDWAAGFLASDSVGLPSSVIPYFNDASAALEELRAQVSAVSAYAEELKAAYEAAPKGQKDNIKAMADDLNDVLYAARKIVNQYTVGEGGTMGSWDVFLRSHQHAHDLLYVCNAISALNKGQMRGTYTALETVYTMEWGKYVGREAFTTIMDWMINDEMYWGGFMDQQQAYVDVHWIYLGLKEGTLTNADANAALHEIRAGQLIPWLIEDLEMLKSGWTEAAHLLSSAIP